jgi:hypothetical protein
MPDLNMMNNPRPENHEAAMARADLYKLANYSFKLFKMIQEGQELEGWVQAKITKSADYIASVYHFMEYEMKFSEYGEKLETADIYSESVKREFKRKLTEARVKLEKLKEKNAKDLEEGWEDMMKAAEKKKAEKGTGKFDSKKTSTGTVYTRKSSTFDDGGKDSDTKKAEKKEKSKKTEKKVKEEIYTAKMGQPPQDIDGGSAPAAKKAATPNKKPVAQTKKPTTPSKVAVKVKEAAKPDFLDMDKDGDKKEPMKKAVADKKKGAVKEAAKPDFLDVDKDGDKKEPMKKAIADKKKGAAPKKGVNPFAKKKTVKEGLGRELGNTPRDNMIKRLSPTIMDQDTLMKSVAKVINNPEFTSDTLLKIVDAGSKITHPVGKYLQKEFEELQYDLGRKYEDMPEEVAEQLIVQLKQRTQEVIGSRN